MQVHKTPSGPTVPYSSQQGFYMPVQAIMYVTTLRHTEPLQPYTMSFRIITLSIDINILHRHNRSLRYVSLHSQPQYLVLSQNTLISNTTSFLNIYIPIQVYDTEDKPTRPRSDQRPPSKIHTVLHRDTKSTQSHNVLFRSTSPHTGPEQLRYT